jgi:hypothetical protein
MLCVPSTERSRERQSKGESGGSSNEGEERVRKVRMSSRCLELTRQLQERSAPEHTSHDL